MRCGKSSELLRKNTRDEAEYTFLNSFKKSNPSIQLIRPSRVKLISSAKGPKKSPNASFACTEFGSVLLCIWRRHSCRSNMGQKDCHKVQCHLQLGNFAFSACSTSSGVHPSPSPIQQKAHIHQGPWGSPWRPDWTPVQVWPKSWRWLPCHLPP